ncbi:hypothetical protein AY599_18495 [Leptolyngbya valderiana BDU 20041]|nr:hypothetical protein AY599_18495 [Leptolyngbya valderiana BDU 20041]
MTLQDAGSAISHLGDNRDKQNQDSDPERDLEEKRLRRRIKEHRPIPKPGAYGRQCQNGKTTDHAKIFGSRTDGDLNIR